MNIISSIRNLFGSQAKTIDLVDEEGQQLTDFDIISHSYEAQSEVLKKGFDDLELLKKGFADGGDEDKFLAKAEKLIKGIEKASTRLLETAERFDNEAAEILSKADEEGQKKVKKVMDEWKEGKLNSSSGDKVTDHKQAIAIALSEAGLNKKKKVKKAEVGQELIEAMGTGNTPGGKEYIEKSKIEMFREDFFKEHKRLLDVLENGTEEERKKEAKRQREEVAGYKAQDSDLEKGGVGSGRHKGLFRSGNDVANHIEGNVDNLKKLHPQAERTFWSGYEKHLKQAKKEHNKQHSLAERRNDYRKEFSEEDHHEPAMEAGFQKVYEKHLKKAQESDLVKAKDGDYANVIVKNAQGKILFLKRAADKIVAPNQYCLPGGHIDKEESPIQAAARELKEEANISLKSDKLYTCGKIKCADGKWAYYFNTYDLSPDEKGALAILDGESQGACWMSQEEWDKADLFFDLKDHLAAIMGGADAPEIKLKKGEEDELEKGGPGSGRREGRVKVGDKLFFTHRHPNKILRGRGGYVEKIDKKNREMHLNMHDNDNDEKTHQPVSYEHIFNEHTE